MENPHACRLLLECVTDNKIAHCFKNITFGKETLYEYTVNFTNVLWASFLYFPNKCVLFKEGNWQKKLLSKCWWFVKVKKEMMLIGRQLFYNSKIRIDDINWIVIWHDSKIFRRISIDFFNRPKSTLIGFNRPPRWSDPDLRHGGRLHQGRHQQPRGLKMKFFVLIYKLHNTS